MMEGVHGVVGTCVCGDMGIWQGSLTGAQRQLMEEELPELSKPPVRYLVAPQDLQGRAPFPQIPVVPVIFSFFFIDSHLQFYPQDHVYELLNTIDACQCHFDIVRFFAILFYPRAMEMVSVGTVWGEMGLEEWLFPQDYNIVYTV